MQALFPAVIQAATALGVDADLAAKLREAIPKIRPLPRTDAATQSRVLPPDADATGQTVIAPSAEPNAAKHNTENLGLETAWPYSIVGDSGPVSDLARRTYRNRGRVAGPDWSFDSLQAARLGLGEEVAKSLIEVTEAYQTYPSGLASWKGKPGQEPYIERAGVLAAAVAEAVAQDYDGLLRIAPALPPGWDVDGTVYIQHRSKVHVQVRDGTPITVVIDAGADYNLRVRNPWPGHLVAVLDSAGRTVVGGTAANVLTFSMHQGSTYFIQRVSRPVTDMPFARITGTPASAAKHLGGVQIGLDAVQR
jgi:hypothetical protein